MPDEQRTPEAQLPAAFQRVADEVAGQDGRLRVEADGAADVVCAVVAGGQQDIVGPVRPPLAQLDADGIDERLFAHGLDDAGRAEDGDAAGDAEAGIEGLLGQCLARRHGNDD